MAEKTSYPSTDLQNLLGRQLDDIEEKYAPKTIYYMGSMQIPLPCARVSVIGTREPTEEGIAAAEHVASVCLKTVLLL